MVRCVMDDALSGTNIIRISELTCDNAGCQFLHDNGLSAFEWKSISCLFLMLPRRQSTVGATPDIFFYDRREKSVLYIDGIRFNYRKFLRKEIESSGEKNLSLLIKKLLPYLKEIYLDGTLDDFLEGKHDDIPAYSGPDEITYYLHAVSKRAAAAMELRLQKQKWAGKEEGIDAKEWDAGDLIDENLRVKEVLKGGMGVVYIVNDISRSRLFALKTIQRQFFWDKRTYDMFVREAELWVRLEKHPNIVHAHFVKIHGGYPFIYLEYVKGSNLDSQLQRGPLSINQSLDYAIQFCRGMDYAFKKLGIVHRDIKPSNCLLTEEGTLKIADFGLSGIFSERLDSKQSPSPPMQDDSRLRGVSTGAFQGTLPYMAPERFKNMSHYDIRSDIYSFGVMMYEMLTGKQPIIGSDFAEFVIVHNRGEVLHIKSIHPILPDELAGMIMKCLEKDPGKRYQSFGALQDDLKSFYREFMKVEYSTKDMEEDLKPAEWVNKGLSLAALGQHEEALNCYDHAIRKEHRMAGAWLAKGNSLFTLEKYKDALLCYNKVIETEPQNEESWIKKGFSFFKLKRFQDALSCYNEAIKINYQNEEAWIKKGLYYTYQKNLSEGLKCFDQALRINEKSCEALFNKGILTLEQGDALEAISLFNKSLEINPRWLDVWLKKAETLMDLGIFEDSLSAYSKALEIDAGNIDALLGKARCFIKTGDFSSALAVISLALEKEHSHKEALFLLHKVHFYQGRMEASLNACQRLLELEPERVDIILAKGFMLEKTFEFDAALENFRQALKMTPTNPDLQLHIKSLEFRRQIFRECVETVLKREVGFPRGVTSGRLLIPSEEKREFQEFLRGGEKPSPEKLFMMGVNAYQDRDLWQSVQFIMESLNDKPDNPQAWLWSGKIFEELEFFDNALDSYGQYLKLVPDAANVWLEVGNLYKKKNRVDKLIDCLIQALKIDSRNWKFWLLAISYLQTMGGWSLAAGMAMKALDLMRTYYLDMEIREKKYEALFDMVLNRYEKANELSNEILASAPKDIFFTCHKGDSYMRLKMESEAANIFFKASRFGKRNPFFLYYLALFNHFTLNEETALKYFQLAARKEMDLTEASLMRAILLFRQKDFAGALQCLNLIMHQDPYLNRARELKSVILASQARFREALKCIDEGLSINPWDAGLLFNKVMILRLNNEDPRTISEILDLYRKYHPLEVVPWNVQASLLLEERKIQEAKPYCEKALIIDSLSAEAWNNMGVLHFHNSELEKSLKCFAQALELDQNLDEAWNNRGCLYLKLGRFIEAGIDFNRLSGLNSEVSWGSYNKALYLCRKGLFDWSVEEFERAEELLEGQHKLYIEKAICNYLRNDRKLTEENLTNAVKIDYESPEAWFFKALLLTASEEHWEALQYYDQCLQRDEGFSNAWLCKGISLNASGEKSQGSDAIERANQLNPQNHHDPAKDTLSQDEVSEFLFSLFQEPIVVPVLYAPAPSRNIDFLIREIEFFF